MESDAFPGPSVAGQAAKSRPGRHPVDAGSSPRGSAWNPWLGRPHASANLADYVISICRSQTTPIWSRARRRGAAFQNSAPHTQSVGYLACPIRNASHSARRSASSARTHRIDSWWDWLCWTCWRIVPRSGRCSALSMMRNGSIGFLLTVAFVARRLVAERIAIVISFREPCDERDFVSLPELTVNGLSETDVGQLLDTVVKWPMDPRVRNRIIAEARGNPLALLELPRA
jgi:hypothetical protein